MILVKETEFYYQKQSKTPQALGRCRVLFFLPETNDLPSSHTHGMETTAYKPVG